MTPKPLLHRDDPEAAPLVGNIKVTRDDWLNIGLDVLIRDGEERVKVLALAEAMGSRGRASTGFSNRGRTCWMRC